MEPRPGPSQASQPGVRELAQLRAQVEATRAVYDGFWQKWSKGGRFSTSTCPPSPAAVTGLMFLQVPPYSEVFQDSVHTYKLNEQDTDVRAALLLPLSTPPLLLLFSSSSSSIHLSPRGFSHMQFMFSFTAKTTFFLSLLTPLIFSFFPLPLPPTLPVCFPLSPRPVSPGVGSASCRNSDFARRSVVVPR